MIILSSKINETFLKFSWLSLPQINILVHTQTQVCKVLP